MSFENPKVAKINHPGILLPEGYVTTLSVTNEVKNDNNLHKGPIPDALSEDRVDEIKVQEKEMQNLFEKYEATKSDSLGFVQENEVQIAKKRIKECLGFDPPNMVGWSMAVVIYEQKHAVIDGRKTNLWLGEISTNEEKYRNCVGLVVSQGNECYLGKRFREHLLIRLMRKVFGKYMKPCIKKPWCRVGDWIIFPRHEGQLVNYRGVPLMMLPDIKFWSVVENPEYVSRF